MTRKYEDHQRIGLVARTALPYGDIQQGNACNPPEADPWSVSLAPMRPAAGVRFAHG